MLEIHNSIRLALWLGVAELFSWGLLYARRQGWAWPTAVVTGVVNACFGLAIVILEVVIH